eukprot:TRINITY_DN31822_c0_g1_i1.p1 TRINITY_DN31822_c0_g1~~TRINITY_DN31822_c0_g1_i1.p1  ORF type:complete len:413 (+),score=69.81 TRINITY_DN31822_c0_g1_i1:54-1292(+)
MIAASPCHWHPTGQYVALPGMVDKRRQPSCEGSTTSTNADYQGDVFDSKCMGSPAHGMLSPSQSATTPGFFCIGGPTNGATMIWADPGSQDAGGRSPGGGFNSHVYAVLVPGPAPAPLPTYQLLGSTARQDGSCLPQFVQGDGRMPGGSPGGACIGPLYAVAAPARTMENQAAQKPFFSAPNTPQSQSPGVSPEAAGYPQPVLPTAPSQPVAVFGGDMMMSSGSDGIARWQADVARIGILSKDGHTFQYDGPDDKRRKRKYSLKPLALLLESRLHTGGKRSYEIHIDGTIGKAGGLGFMFHDVLERKAISRMHCVFLNQSGELCMRGSGKRVRIASEPLNSLDSGCKVLIQVDLDRLEAKFEVHHPLKKSAATSMFSVARVVPAAMLEKSRVSGFFAAVVQDVATLRLTGSR